MFGAQVFKFIGAHRRPPIILLKIGPEFKEYCYGFIPDAAITNSMKAQYLTGIKSGLLSGIITGVIFSIMISALIYLTMTNTPTHTENLQINSNTIANFFGFGSNFEKISMKDLIINEVVLIIAFGAAGGILLGIATAIVMPITRKSPSFSISLLVIIALIAYYSQTYGVLYESISYARLSSDVDNYIKFLMIMLYLIPPIVYLAFEGILLNYFWGAFTVVNLEPAKTLKEYFVPSAPRPPKIPIAPEPVLQSSISNDLKNYIFLCIDKGISPEEIRLMFKGYGYDPKAVNEVIEEKIPAKI